MPDASQSSPAKSRFIFIFSGFFLFLALAAGGYGYHLHLYEMEKLRIQEELKIRQAEERAKKIQEEKDAEFQKITQQYLDDFRDTLGEKMKAYKKNRRMVRELIKPFNHETVEDSKNSYTHFTKELLPYLRSQSSDVIDTFQVYRSALDTQVFPDDDERQEEFINLWHDMTKDQLDKYVNYFIQDDILLSVYRELIEFYYVHSNLMKVDLDENVFLFDRKKDELKHLEILSRLKDIRQDQ